MSWLGPRLARLDGRGPRYMIETAVVPASLDRYPGLAAQPAVTQLLTFQYFPAGASRIDMLDSLTVFLTDRCSARYTYVGKTKIDVFHR